VTSSRLILIRHGLPDGHEGRCVGHHDTALAANGARAVAALAASWISNGGAPPTRIVASDLRRAADSARIIAEAWSVPLVLDADFREMHFGDWEGRTWDEIALVDDARLRSWADNWTNSAPPGGESLDVFAHRVAGALARIRSGVIVSHAGWIRVATSIMLGEPLATTFDRAIDFAHAAIFEFDGARHGLAMFNVGTLE
jgi:broad specificity phosphatase PhoE